MSASNVSRITGNASSAMLHSLSRAAGEPAGTMLVTKPDHLMRGSVS
jgi:hypothetical protein